MTKATLNELLPHTRAIIGLVCLGWEEVRAYIEASQCQKTPVALMVGPGARANMPLSIWGKMLNVAIENTDIPITLHLDHGRSIDEINEALDVGFSSVMFDGSHFPLEENINKTRQMVELAQRYGASSEGEIGYVGYAHGAESKGTDYIQAKQFALETSVDFMAVSIGNVHLQKQSNAAIDWSLLAELSTIGTPLVIHGGSGVDVNSRMKMANEYLVRKFNIGTEIRQVFGAELRAVLQNDDNIFDHLSIMNLLHEPLVSITKAVINPFKL